MLDLKVIIPVHEYNDEIEPLLKRAIGSVPTEYPIVISCPNEIVDDIENGVNEFDGDIKVVSGEQGDFTYLVNRGVEQINDATWFSILEFDDEYTDIWFEDAEKYIKHNPSISVYLPLTDLLEFKDGKYLGYGNEAPWASAFSEEIGFIDHKSLENFFDFFLTGSIFNTKDFNNVGGLKEDLPLVFWHEFLLRMTHFDKKAFVIPKVGYKHYLNREGSLFDYYKNNFDEETTRTWVEHIKTIYKIKNRSGWKKPTFAKEKN